VAGAAGATVAWLRDTGNGLALESSRGAYGTATFSPAATAGAADAGAPVLGGDGDGNALAAYWHGGLVAQPLDGAGPRLGDVQIRPAGFALEPYPFSIAPADAWSAVASSSFDFGDGQTAAGPSATHAFAVPGWRTVTATAADAVGNATTVTRQFQVAPALDRTPPVITHARLDSTRFRVSGRVTAVTARVRRGTRFRYTLSEPAQVVIFFERVTLGPRRHGKRRRVYQPMGLITRHHPQAGNVSVGFTGRIVAGDGPIKLIDTTFPPGRYRATLVASDAARNVSKPVQLAFTIVR
jgi:hypothetical protein